MEKQLRCRGCKAPIDDSGVRLPGGDEYPACRECEEAPCTCTDTRKLCEMDCPRHGIAASNKRQSNYWQRVGGHD